MTRRILLTAAVAPPRGRRARRGRPPPSVAFKLKVGRGAGVPAVEATAVWVPNTKDGTVSRVDPRTRKVVKTIKLGAPPRFTGYLDAAVSAGGSVWLARDIGDEVDRIDPKTNRLAARIHVESRPGGLAAGGGYVWAFHFLGPYVTRLDQTTGAKKVFTVQGAAGTGIAYAGDAVWLLTANPSTVIKLDPETGAVLAKVPVTPSAPPKHGIVETWWVAAGGDSLWVVNANWDRVTRVDVATAKVVASIPVPVQIPFGVAWYRGAAWVAGAGKVVRIDPATNKPSGTVTLSSRSQPVFTQVAAGPAGLWATDYDEGDALPPPRPVVSARERARPRPPPPDRRLPRGRPRRPLTRAVLLREARVVREAASDERGIRVHRRRRRSRGDDRREPGGVRPPPDRAADDARRLRARPLDRALRPPPRRRRS